MIPSRTKATFHAAIAFILAACTMPVADAGALATRVSGHAAAPESKAVRITAFRLADGNAVASRVRLTAIEGGLRERLNAQSDPGEKRVAVGASRSIAAEATRVEGSTSSPRWIGAAGGLAARIEITSPGAESVRLGLQAKSLPAGAEIRFRGTTARTLGPVSGQIAVDATRELGVYWTPVTEGETQSVEIWIPSGTDPDNARFAFETLSHLAAKASTLFKSAGSCNEDVVCHSAGNAALANAARSVAKLVYTENGVTYLCSGTLISGGDAAAQVPYLYTAAHCIGSRAAAATLNTFWFFDAAQCGSRNPIDYRQLTGGATLLYSNDASDAALVRLAERAPEGTWFSGWDATRLATGSALVGLHHPGGDLKKIALGQALDPTSAAGGGSYATVAWIAGATERGSSGSGIFTPADGEYLLRGGLVGGSSSCTSTGTIADPSNRDYYSRFDLEAPQLRPWLAAGPAPLEDYTDMWWNPDEPGWGISVQQHANNRVFVTWYTYDRDGKPTWFVIPEATWTTVSALEGAIYRTTGPSYEGAYDARRFTVAAAGTGRVEFGQAGRAIARFTVDGVSVEKSLVRQEY